MKEQHSICRSCQCQRFHLALKPGWFNSLRMPRMSLLLLMEAETSPPMSFLLLLLLLLLPLYEEIDKSHANRNARIVGAEVECRLRTEG